MSVSVKLYGYLIQIAGASVIEVPAGQKISQLLDFLKVPPELSLLSVVNGQIVETDYSLQDGDRFELIPPIDGGQFLNY